MIATAAMLFVVHPSESVRAAQGCAPGTSCLLVEANGSAAAEPGPYIAQCTGTFPDFIAEKSMVLPSGQGPWFRLSQAYPSSPPPVDAPWLNIDFSGGVKGANDYLYALRDYAFDGMIAADFRPEANKVRQWFHMPMMNFGPHPREPVHGVTSERQIVGPELGVKPGVTLHNYAIGFYNAAGGHAIWRVWSARAPNIRRVRFPNGTMTFKILFSDAAPEAFQGPDILAGAPQWTIATPTGPANIRLMQMDVAAVDPRSPTGWVFGTFAYDSSARDASPWNRLRPVGLSWGNDFGFTPADQQAGKKLQETTISDQIPAYAAGHLGWAGRANGPVDNPISGCLSCHSTAQYPVKAGLNFTPACTTDAKKMIWFRDLDGTQAFGGVDATCAQESLNPPPSPLDFSLQMSVAVQSVLQFGDMNSCSPAKAGSPAPALDLAAPKSVSDGAPRIER